MADRSRLVDCFDPWRDVIHSAALILPRPSVTEYSELKNSIEARGVLTPLATYVDAKGDHWLLDGVSRLQVMIELGRPVLGAEDRRAIPTTPYREVDGLDPYELAVSLNVTRRHLNAEQKREAGENLLAERPDLSSNAVAKLLGVSHHTVEDARANWQSANKAGVETEAETPAEAPEPTPAPERREASGRRARGRKPRAGTAKTARVDGQPVGAAAPVKAKEIAPEADDDLPALGDPDAVAKALGALLFEDALAVVVGWHKGLPNIQRQNAVVASLPPIRRWLSA